MLMGRTTYESFSKIYAGRQDPWADRLNTIKKYVFSGGLERVEWNNSTFVRGDVIAELRKLKQHSLRKLKGEKDVRCSDAQTSRGWK